MAYIRNFRTISSNRAVISGSNVQVTGSLFGSVISGTTSQFISLTSSGDVIVSGDLYANGGTLTTAATTFNLLNTNATTINAFQAASVISIGSTNNASTVLRITGSTDASINLISNDSSITDGEELGRVSLSAPITSSSTTLGSRGVIAFLRDGLDGAGKIQFNCGVGNSTSTRTNLLNITKDGCTIRDGLIIGATAGSVTQGSGDLIVSGTINTSLGSAASPTYSFIGDINTGIFSPTADTIAFTEGGSEAMRINSSANVLIGTTTDTANRLSIAASTNDNLASIRIANTYVTTGYWNIAVPGTGKNLDFSYNGSTRGYLTNATNVSNIDFTGQHRSIVDETVQMQEDNIGLIVVSTGKYESFSNTSEISINEALPKVSLSTKRNQKNVFGVISDKEDTDSSTREYKIGNFVNVYDKQPEDNRLIINSLGEGGIWICNINGNLENGDYITSCEIPGYGMKQDDDSLKNYTVAKITCDCDFNLNSQIYQCEEFEFEGTVYRRAFVGCTYHCG